MVYYQHTNNLLNCKHYKNDNIHKSKAQQIGQTNNDKNRIAANFTEYHILSKLIIQRIIIPKFMMIRQLFDVKNVSLLLQI